MWHRLSGTLSSRAVLGIVSSAITPKVPQGAITSWGSNLFTCTSRRMYRAGGSSEETALVQMMTSKPRHVGRRVRQMLMGQNRKIAQFRNTVTFLMIVLQAKLQAKEIPPSDAAAIIEGVMQECLYLHQSDMAHLLFRAALRFKKFEVHMTVTCLRLLFESYRGNEAMELMGQLGKELQDTPEYRSLAMAALIFAGKSLEANAIRQSIPPGALTTEDYMALIHGFTHAQQWAAFNEVVDEILGCERSDVDVTQLISAAIRAASRSEAVLSENIFRAAAQHAITPTPEAIAAVARLRLETVTSLEEISRIEEALKRELKVNDLGFPAATAIINRSAQLFSKNFLKGDEVMLLKVNQLRGVVDSQIANGEIEDIDSSYVIAILRGYGALGKTDDMEAAFRSIKTSAPATIDALTYVEVMKWYCVSGNVRAVLSLKEEMERDGAYHHPRIYALLLKALDRYYPKLTERYYNEMRKNVHNPDANMYAVLLRVFCDLNRKDIVEELYKEIRERADQGHAVYNEGVIIHLLRQFRRDRAAFDNVLQIANRHQFLTSAAVQGRVVDGYAAQGRTKELEVFIASLPQMSTPVFLSLLRAYTEAQDIKNFIKTIETMKTSGIEITDHVFNSVANACVRWRDSAAVREVLHGIRAMVGVKSCRYYATAATICQRLGDYDTVDDLWNELRSSNLPISMETFNKFLELNVQRQNLTELQDVLKTMMERVPPNPVTTTTVVDMLGKMGRLTEMEVLIDEMSSSRQVQPTLFTYHHAMHAYARHGDVIKMEAMRSRLRRDGFKENHVTYNILLEGYGRAKRYEYLQELISERHAQQIPMDDAGYAILLNMLAKGRMVDEVNKTVDAIMNRGSSDPAGVTPRMFAAIAEAYSFIQDLSNVEKYVGMLLAHPGCRETQIETVFLIYHRLRNTNKLENMLKKYQGSEFIYNICIGAFAKAQNYDRVAEILRVIVQKKYSLHTNTAIVVSSILLKAGNTELAQEVLRLKTANARALKRLDDENPPPEDTTPKPTQHLEPQLGVIDPVHGVLEEEE